MKKINFLLYLFFLFMIFFVGCDQQTQEASNQIPVIIEIGQFSDPVYADTKLTIPFFIKNSGPFALKNLKIYLLSSGFVKSQTASLNSLDPNQETILFMPDIEFVKNFLNEVSNSKSLEFEYAYEYQGNSMLSFCVANPKSEYDPNLKTLCNVRDSPKITNTPSHIVVSDAKVEIQTKNSMMFEFKIKKVTNEKLYVEEVNKLNEYLKDRVKGAKESLRLSISSQHFDSSNSKCYFNDVYGSEITRKMSDPFTLYFEGDTINVKCYIILKNDAQNQLDKEPYSFQALIAMNYDYTVAGKLSKGVTIINPR